MLRTARIFALLSIFTAGLACAQMKPAQPEQQSSSPVSVSTPTAPVVEPPPLESAKRIKRDEAIRMVKSHKAVFVDVRPKDSYVAEHVKGAISLPLSELMTRLRELPPGKYIITYCA